MRITLIRHAETEANAAHIWQGHTDAALSPAGATQCARLGARLGRNAFDAVLCSDLGRTCTTAQSFSEHAERRAEWREANVGNWEGFRQAEIAATQPEQMKRLLAGEDLRLGDTGETLVEFRTRVIAAFDAVVREHQGKNSHVAVVTHGGVIASLLVHLTGKQRQLSSRTLVGLANLGRLGNTSLTTIELSDESGPKIITFNDTSHVGPTTASTKGARLARVTTAPSDASGVHENAASLFSAAEPSHPSIVASANEVASLANRLLECEAPHAIFAPATGVSATHFEWIDGKIALRDHGVALSAEKIHAAL